LPEIVQFKAWPTIEFDSFWSGNFLFVDPIYKLPWFLFFVGYFIDFEVEECFFGTLYGSAEGFLVF